jgi:two-component system response regulator YesN
MGMNRILLYDSVCSKAETLQPLRINNRLGYIQELVRNSNHKFIREVDNLFAIEMSNGFAQTMYYSYITTRLIMLLIMLGIPKGFTVKEGDQLMSIVHNCAENIDYSKERIKEHLVSLMLENKSDYSTAVEGALRFVEMEFKRDISLSDVAKAINVHKGYLSRIFKQEVGENIVQYITNKKINYAKYLLTNTSAKLFEVSKELGYANPQYFSIVFKKNVGISPLTYKKDHDKKSFNLHGGI